MNRSVNSRAYILGLTLAALSLATSCANIVGSCGSDWRRTNATAVVYDAGGQVILSSLLEVFESRDSLSGSWQVMFSTGPSKTQLSGHLREASLTVSQDTLLQELKVDSAAMWFAYSTQSFTPTAEPGAAGLSRILNAVNTGALALRLATDVSGLESISTVFHVDSVTSWRRSTCDVP